MNLQLNYKKKIYITDDFIFIILVLLLIFSDLSKLLKF
jgi:hypothetical protein